jgi:PAS domain-containing protein
MLNQHRTQLGFTHRDIAENIPGAVMVHRRANGEILYANDELISLMECDGLKDFFDYTGGFYDGMMHPDDRGRVRRQLAAAAQGSVAGSKSYTEFRVHTKSGKTHEVACVGKFTTADGIGDVCYDLITGRSGPLGLAADTCL